MAIGALGVITLYQMGVIKRLPDPPLPKVDSERVVSSDEAYNRLAAPDAVLGVNSYALTMALAAMGGKDRARKTPWIPLALAGKIMFDLFQVVRMTRKQWTQHRTLCFWCLASAAATIASATLIPGEARAGLRKIAS